MRRRWFRFRSYRYRLLFPLAILFLFFSVNIVAVLFYRERRIKTDALAERLDIYAGLLHRHLHLPPQEAEKAIEQAGLPSHVRLTLITPQGKVIFDNTLTQGQQTENHLSRPEIREALAHAVGRDIRISQTNGREYFYFARNYDAYLLRLALPYDVQLQNFLDIDRNLLYTFLALFALFLFGLHLVAVQMARPIRELQRYVQHEGEGEGEYFFSDDELGDIAQRLGERYQELAESRRLLTLEREKLLLHIQSTEEGVCFYNIKGKVELYNGLFLRHLALLTGNGESKPEDIWQLQPLAPARTFLRQPSHEDGFYEYTTQAQGRTFRIRLNLFDDRSYELILHDISQQERNRLLKREMSSNIAHELRTPVTSIRGYLELLTTADLPAGQARHFARKAYEQSLRLSDLIRDVSLLSRIERGKDEFPKERLSLADTAETVIADLAGEIEASAAVVENRLGADAAVHGNASLLYALFRNLIENSIAYGGERVHILLETTRLTADTVHLRYADNGKGVDEQHLPHLFERFYRVDGGRTRTSGGSGLGLSIVRHAVEIHGGDIVARRPQDGGLEFLITLPRTT